MNILVILRQTQISLFRACRMGLIHLYANKTQNMKNGRQNLLDSVYQRMENYKLDNPDCKIFSVTSSFVIDITKTTLLIHM